MITLDDLILPDELVWVDETDWSPVAQSESRLLSGSLEIQCGTKLSGRPLTLSREQGEVWAPRQTVLALMALAAEPAKEMTLTYHDGRVFRVVFRQSEQAIEARQVKEFNNPELTPWYQIKSLKFLILETL